jgi:predicted 3-demethylubiquinone-9 3-methyltransferase (glyoxalase superfamily)
MSSITPFLWFDTNAEDAARFYISIFPNSRIVGELRPDPAGPVVVINLELDGQRTTFLNGGPAHQLTEAFSFSVSCETQAEIDGYWSKLGEGGKELSCGWIKDRFGLCWQIVPARIGELLKKPGAMRAMLSMMKLDIAALEAAASQ